ncbi:MAG: LolA-like putative outer membrane lipoprotein chaperone [Bacteroidia bacterium]|nr:LolA-like putative outer membrane lipoprotein chaperone [Bacteroidia bacterium]
MKKYIFLIAVLISASVAFAQRSAEARGILDKAYGAYENSKGIKMSFNLATTDESGAEYPAQKGVAFIKGNKFKIEMPTLNTWFDGKTQWVLMKDFNEVNISNPSGEEIASISPLALLGMYKSGYTLKQPVTKTVNGKSAFVIDMIPTASRSEFKDISVAIDKKSHTILQVGLTMKNGMKNNIDVLDYNANYNFPDSDFVFDKDKYPKAEIIDLR